ncbi:amino acid ABC transporter permease [Acetilactobacillus jinshanensis]|uniref:Amino acid ABC transporter permease n=1 Tax=Acetilactobacillus jinshanensis TaxID=1720083 RepID=A0A4P6ZM28_9LACO|nr:amino acid ABC transporter permease [Acetilactobacillus jinshanensis]QBP18290.1 amino acid ABC transporter permease [Acetilactobacillus jinshanensis]URL61154.1 amino acid ABC transporter permease [uncultured bacterium]
MWHIVAKATPQLVVKGLEVTIPLALVSFAIGLIIATFTALILISKKRGWFRIIKAIFGFYVWLFRSTPMLVQLFITYFGLPYLTIPGILPNGIKMSSATAALIVFSLNEGAYCSETIRSSVLSIPEGQWEAAYSLGMTKRQVLKKVIFPQALRVAIPPLSNSFISTVKGTSLVYTISVVDMFGLAQQIAAQNYQPMIMYTLTAALYAVACTILTILQKYLEKTSSKYVAR